MLRVAAAGRRRSRSSCAAAVVFGRAVGTTRAHRTHRERAPRVGRGREGAAKLRHGQAWVPDLLHGQERQLRVGVGQRQRDEGRPHA